LQHAATLTRPLQQSATFTQPLRHEESLAPLEREKRAHRQRLAVAYAMKTANGCKGERTTF
jgi:hypothetical protein